MVRPLRFVYGSLRRGAGGERLMASARFVARLKLAARFDMRPCGQRPVAWSSSQQRTLGECYVASPLLLRRVDRFEQIPHAYRRRLVRTPIGWAWTYRRDGAHGMRRGSLVRQGDWMKRPKGLIGGRAGRRQAACSGTPDVSG